MASHGWLHFHFPDGFLHVNSPKVRRSPGMTVWPVPSPSKCFGKAKERALRVRGLRAELLDYHQLQFASIAANKSFSKGTCDLGLCTPR